jgi:hypothetical protein
MVSRALRFHRFDVARSLGMISAGDDQLCFRHFFSQQIERLDHQFEALVRAPFSECKNAVNRITAS